MSASVDWGRLVGSMRKKYEKGRWVVEVGRPGRRAVRRKWEMKSRTREWKVRAAFRVEAGIS